MRWQAQRDTAFLHVRYLVPFTFDLIIRVSRVTLIYMSTGLQITIRQLHARTGHFVRKAIAHPIVVTDNGKPVAEITPVGKNRVKGDEVPYFARRKLRPGFKKLMGSGALRPKPGQKTMDEILDEVRADSSA